MWINVYPEVCQALLRLPHDLRPIHNAQPGLGQLAKKDVLGHREVGDQAQFLVDHAYAKFLSALWREVMDLLTPDEDAALALGNRSAEDLHQSRLASAILTQQDVHLTFVQIKVDVIQGVYAGELLVYLLHL